MANMRELEYALIDILEIAEPRMDVEDRPNGEGVRPDAWMQVVQIAKRALGEE